MRDPITLGSYRVPPMFRNSKIGKDDGKNNYGNKNNSKKSRNNEQQERQL